MSTPASRLHTDTRGLASVEFILAIPVFLMMLLVIMDLGKVRTATLHALIATRNAAWAEGAGGACLFLDEMPELVDDAANLSPLGCTSQASGAASGQFWSEMDEAGGEQLTETTRGAPAPEIVEASVRMDYRTYDWPGMSFDPIQYRFTTMSRQSFMHDENALRVGYDSEMNAIFQRETGQLMDLFPRVFPGAQ